MTGGDDPVTREECERHRARCGDRIDLVARDLREEADRRGEAILAEVERRDGERKDDYRTLADWMVRIETKVNCLPNDFQNAIDKKFDRIFQVLVALIISILIAGILAYLGIGGGAI